MYMFTSILSVKFIKCMFLKCLSPLFVLYFESSYDGRRPRVYMILYMYVCSIQPTNEDQRWPLIVVRQYFLVLGRLSPRVLHEEMAVTVSLGYRFGYR